MDPCVNKKHYNLPCGSPGWHVECLPLPEELPGPEGLDAVLLKQPLHVVDMRLWSRGRKFSLLVPSKMLQ